MNVDSSGYILERKEIFTERSLNVQIFSNIHTVSLIIQIKEFVTKLLNGKTNIIKGVTIENFTENLYWENYYISKILIYLITASFFLFHYIILLNKNMLSQDTQYNTLFRSYFPKEYNIHT